MLPSFAVRLHSASTEKALDRLKERAPYVCARALNRSITSGRVVMTKAIAQDLGLQQQVVREELVIGEAKPTKLTATLTVRGKRIPLIDFRARGPEPSRGRGRGVTARLPGGAGRYPHAFIATMRSGHRGVFQRTGAAKRLPIHELRGPSLPFVFDKYIPLGLERCEAVLYKNLEHEFAFAMRAAAAA